MVKSGFYVGPIMKILLVLAVGAALAGGGRAGAGTIPDQDLQRIGSELFPEIKSFSVREKNWNGVDYFFIAGRIDSGAGKNQALVRTRLGQAGRKALVKKMNPGRARVVFMNIKGYTAGLFWKKGKYYYSLSYVPVDGVKVLSGAAPPGPDFIPIGRGK
ncbi:MAG: hypothetical protein V1816_17150 [Pseudomonadota bacterium]